MLSLLLPCEESIYLGRSKSAPPTATYAYASYSKTVIFFMEFVVPENIHTLPTEGKGSSQGRGVQNRRFLRERGVAFPSFFSSFSKQELLFSLMILIQLSLAQE